MTVNAMHCIDGDRTNEVFFDNVYVDDKFVLGELNKGFYYISEALDYERHTLFAYGQLERMFKVFIDYVKTATRDGKAMREDKDVRRTVADLATDLEAARMHSLRVVNSMQHGRSPNIEAAHEQDLGHRVVSTLCHGSRRVAGAGGLAAAGLEVCTMRWHFCDSDAGQRDSNSWRWQQRSPAQHHCASWSGTAESGMSNARLKSGHLVIGIGASNKARGMLWMGTAVSAVLAMATPAAVTRRNAEAADRHANIAA
jgi:hypothetical protein